MLKRSAICLVIFISLIQALFIISTACAGEKIQTTNKAKMGEWADNGEIKLRVTGVKEYDSWGTIPFSKRFTAAMQKKYERLKNTFDKGEIKVMFVYVEAKNVSEKQKNLGWHVTGAVYDYLYLRGDEGSEQDSNQGNAFYDYTNNMYSTIDIGLFIQDPFPKDAKVSPGGTVKGNVAFFVPTFFAPKVLFTKPNSTFQGYWGKNEMIIKIK